MSLFATEEGTAPSPLVLTPSFRKRKLYPGGPYVSLVGFGSYRIGLTPELGFPECGEALALALEEGVNLIDTSANYGFGQSEILIGRVLKRLFEEEKLKRDNVVIVSKVGYIQGPNIELATMKEMKKEGFEDVYQFTDELWYSIHPSFIADQIDRTLKRLQLSALDVYLLHNPEYILKRYELDGLTREQAQSLFYEKILLAFSYLEKLVDQGLIRAYGISSNHFGGPSEAFDAISLEQIIALAKSLRPDHHFKVIQCPLNWLEVSPIFYSYEETQTSLIGYAKDHGLGVLTNRPFNAMWNDGLVRLTRPPQQVLQHPGIENWINLSRDLEKVARDVLSLTPGYEDATLSEYALATLAWLPGVTSVLCGMRKRDYVLDAKKALGRPMILNSKNILHDIFHQLEFQQETLNAP